MSTVSKQGKLPADSAKLAVPKLDVLARWMGDALAKNFETSSAQVVWCDDLTSWGLAAPGLSGSPQLVEVGGVPNLLNPKYHHLSFRFQDIAQTIGFPSAYFLGATAANANRTKVNAELIPCEDLSSGKRTSKYSKVITHDDAKLYPDAKPGDAVCEDYEYSEMGFLGNLFASQGKPGQAIKLTAKTRVGKENFITCLRKGLTEHVTAPHEHMGFGGAFRVVSGKVKAHVMPDFKRSAMVEGPEIEEWLNFYEMGPDLTCLTTFATGDPTPNSRLHLRLEHTHFFSTTTNAGGHYHFSVTPEEVAYEAYLMPAHRIWRVADAYNRTPSAL